MTASRSLHSARDALLIAYVDGIIDDVEFMVLLADNNSREPYPFWKFEKFNLDALDDDQCRTDFRFQKADLDILMNVLQIPEKITCSQGTTCYGIEGLCRYTDMVPMFGRNHTEICLVFNSLIDHIYDLHHHRNQTWNQVLLSPNKLQNYADCIFQKGAPLNNSVSFLYLILLHMITSLPVALFRNLIANE